MQMVNAQVHEQRQKLILGIAEKHTNERGQIKLQDAFAEQPNLRLQLAELKLDTPVRLNAYVLHMRRKGLLPNRGIKTYAEGVKPKRVGNYKGGKVGRKKRSLADYALVHHIKRLYKGQPQMWEKAFNEHPDWCKRVGYPGKKAMSFVYRALRSKDPGVPFETNGNGVHEPVAPAPAPDVCACVICHWAPSPESSVYVNQWQLLAQHYAEKHSKPVKIPPPPEPYVPKVCPECGFNMRVFMAAFQVASKHSGKADR